MNELDLSNTQALILSVVLIALLLYLKPPKTPKKRLN